MTWPLSRTSRAPDRMASARSALATACARGARRRRRDRRLPAGQLLRPPAHAAPRRRSRRGAQAHHRPGRAAPHRPRLEQEEVGQIELAEFQNRNGLQPIGESFYVETTASGEAIIANPLEGSFGKLVQGALESSNVSVVKELVDMIETQRAYEVNSKAISSVDEMLRFISNNL